MNSFTAIFRANPDLTATDKFQRWEVDYVPAIRDFRAALDAPRGKAFDYNARPTLDAWLAKPSKQQKHK